MEQQNPPIQETPEKASIPLRYLDFTKAEPLDDLRVARVALYPTDEGPTFRITAIHRKEDQGNTAIEETLSNINVQFVVKSVDALPPDDEKRLEEATRLSKTDQSSYIPDVEKGIKFEIGMEGAERSRKYYQVNFAIDPLISGAGSSPQFLWFGEGQAVKINLSVTSDQGEIIASVSPGDSTVKNIHISQGSNSRLDVSNSNQTYFLVEISGDGQYSLAGTYYTI